MTTQHNQLMPERHVLGFKPALRRKVHGRVRLTNNDRWFFIQLYRWVPSVLQVITIIRPETLVRWHRVGFRRYWRWKSSSFGGRPQIDAELRALIRQMSIRGSANISPMKYSSRTRTGLGLDSRELSGQHDGRTD